MSADGTKCTPNPADRAPKLLPSSPPLPPSIPAELEGLQQAGAALWPHGVFALFVAGLPELPTAKSADWWLLRRDPVHGQRLIYGAVGEDDTAPLTVSPVVTQK